MSVRCSTGSGFDEGQDGLALRLSGVKASGAVGKVEFDISKVLQRLGCIFNLVARVSVRNLQMNVKSLRLLRWTLLLSLLLSGIGCHHHRAACSVQLCVFRLKTPVRDEAMRRLDSRSIEHANIGSMLCEFVLVSEDDLNEAFNALKDLPKGIEWDLAGRDAAPSASDFAAFKAIR